MLAIQNQKTLTMQEITVWRKRRQNQDRQPCQIR